MNDSKRPDQDRIYAEPRGRIADFVFDDGVAAVFEDMLERSVPGYAAILGMIELLAAEHAQGGSNLYDLGCSLGGATLALSRGSGDREVNVVGVDNAPAMLARARDKLAGRAGIEWLCADIRDVPLHDASMVVLNFTLQFIPTGDRLALLRRVRQSMRPGGLLVLSEKIRGEDVAADRRLVAMHHAFKRAQGYSELEISQKRTALENVLLPETLDAHARRLASAGFRDVDTWFRCFNFVSMVART